MSFVNTLKKEELNMLRGIVRRVHFKHFDQKHGATFVTNKMIDQLIDSIAPETIEAMIKSGVDKGLR